MNDMKNAAAAAMYNKARVLAILERFHYDGRVCGVIAGYSMKQKRLVLFAYPLLSEMSTTLHWPEQRRQAHR